MSTIRFTASCRRERQVAPGHVVRCDETFTDPAAFETHMAGEHGARKRYAGMNGGECTDWRAAPGWSGGKIAAPHPHRAPRAPKDTAKLTAALVKWQDESWPTPKRWYGPTGPRRVLEPDWETDESTPRTFHDPERVA